MSHRVISKQHKLKITTKKKLNLVKKQIKKSQQSGQLSNQCVFNNNSISVLLNKEPAKQSLLTVASDEIREDVPDTPNNVTKNECTPLSLDIIVSLPSSNTRHRISALSSVLSTPQNPITMENFLKTTDQNNEIKINHAVDNERNFKVAVEVVNHGRVESVLANKQSTVPTKKARAKEADKPRRESNRSKNNNSLTNTRANRSHTMSASISTASTSTASTATASTSSASESTSSASASTASTSAASTSTASVNAKKIVKNILTISKIARSCRNEKEKQVNKDAAETEKVMRKKKECNKCNIRSRHQKSFHNSSEWTTSEATLIYRALASADITYSLFKKIFPNRSWRQFESKLKSARRARAAVACKSNKSNEGRLRRTIKKKRSHINQTHHKNQTQVTPNMVQSSHMKCDKSVDTTDLTSRPETNNLNFTHLPAMTSNFFTDVNIMYLTVFGYFNPLCERQRMAQSYIGVHDRISLAPLPEELSRSILEFMQSIRTNMSPPMPAPRRISPSTRVLPEKRQRRPVTCFCANN